MSDFRKEGLELHGKYLNWLETEYHQTIATANMAHKWQGFQEAKDIYPNLKYVTAGDDRVRDKHKKWDGFIAPIDHPIWKKLLPPNDWGCRCDVIQTDEAPTKGYENFETNVKTAFHNNPAVTGKIFNENSYEKQLTNQQKKSAKRNIEILKNEELLKKDYSLVNKNERFKFEKQRVKSREIHTLFKELNEDETTAVFMYSLPDAYYSYLNEFYRTGKISLGANLDGFDKNTIEALSRILNNALDKIPTRFKGTVYRGTDLTIEELKPYFDALNGKHTHIEKAFMSTTKSKRKMFDGNTNFIVKCKNGAYINDISPLKEDEVLFKSNQKFKVKKIKEDRGNYTIYMDEI